MSDGAPWPRITVVTPSYNQDQFIEETLRSVLLQGYPNLEYIVMDGGSTDGSVEIIRRYEPWLAHWQSEPDEGQAAAVAAGFERSSGLLGAFLNSDDVLFPGALQAIARAFHTHPGAQWAAGAGLVFDGDLSRPGLIRRPAPARMPDTIFAQSVPQPSTFWRMEAYRAVGFDNSYNYILDAAFFSRLCTRFGPPFLLAEVVLAGLREHADAKSARLDPRPECERLAAYWDAHSGPLARFRLRHRLRTWRVHQALSDLLDRDGGLTRSAAVAGALRAIAGYPPAALTRRSLGALRQVMLNGHSRGSAPSSAAPHGPGRR